MKTVITLLLAVSIFSTAKADEVKQISDSKELGDVVYLINESLHGPFSAFDGDAIDDYTGSVDFAETFTCDNQDSEKIVQFFMEKARFIHDSQINKNVLVKARDALLDLFGYGVEVCYASDGELTDRQGLIVIKNLDNNYEMYVEWSQGGRILSRIHQVETPEKVQESIPIFNEFVESDGNKAITDISEFNYEYPYTPEELTAQIERLLVRVDYVRVTHMPLKDNVINSGGYSSKFEKALRKITKYINKKSGKNVKELTYSDNRDGFYTTILINEKEKTIIRVSWNSGE